MNGEPVRAGEAEAFQVATFWRTMLFGKGPGGHLPAGRDLRIDTVRGLILLVIFVNHMPGNAVSEFMPHNYGFSDAADIFVLLAGVSAVLAYGKLIDQRGLMVGGLKVGARIWTLYVAHIALFLLVCGVVATAIVRTQNPLYLETTNIAPFFGDTVTALLRALALIYQPHYLDILPLYIVLLACFPLIYVAVRMSPLLTLGLSVTLWLAATRFNLNLPNEPGAGGWFFNPFAWQLVFTIGVVSGRLLMIGGRLPQLPVLDLVALGVLIFAVMVKQSVGNPFGLALLSDWIENLQMGSDKTNLASSRVVHLLALFWLFVRYVPARALFLQSRVAGLLGAMGRHSLEVFCAGVMLSVAGQIVLAEYSFSGAAQLIVTTGGITLLAGLGAFLSWYKSVTTRTAASAGGQVAGASSPV